MNNDNKFAFTIAELILTTVIMAVVCVIAPVVILKRNVKPAVAKKFDFIAKCTTRKCIYDAHTATLIKSNKKTETKLDYNKNSNEFYVIELLGGGAGGTQKSIGYPGESKIVYMPSLEGNKEITNSENTNKGKFEGILTGYYLMEVGRGGGNNRIGEDSKICIINEDEAKEDKISSISCDDANRIVIATAKGGIKSTEKETSDNLRQASLHSSTPNDTINYGRGGAKGTGENAKGIQGIIVIK